MFPDESTAAARPCLAKGRLASGSQRGGDVAMGPEERVKEQSLEAGESADQSWQAAKSSQAPRPINVSRPRPAGRQGQLSEMRDGVTTFSRRQKSTGSRTG